MTPQQAPSYVNGHGNGQEPTREQLDPGLDDPRAQLGVREVRAEQPHREKRSSPLSFDNGKYGQFHCHQSSFFCLPPRRGLGF
jgi:hypothetical protein